SDVMHRSHRFYPKFSFFRTVRAVHAKMNLSIDRRHFFKYRLPIDTPAGEDCIAVPCNSENERRTKRTRQPKAFADILNSLVWSNRHDRLSGNLKSTVAFQQRRVALSFLCGHFFKSRATL